MSDLTDVKFFLASLIRPIIKEAIREEISALSIDNQVIDEIGGIDLATNVTRLSKQRIYTLVSQRAIPHSKRGNRLTFTRSELIKWLQEAERPVEMPTL